MIFRRSHSSSTSSYRSHKSKSRKRSHSRERSKHSKSHRRSKSKEKHRSRRSRSRSYIQEYTSKPKRYSSSSDDSSDSSERSVKHISKKVEKSGNVEIIETEGKQLPVPDSRVLDEINEDKFKQKQFSSSGKKVAETIVIDLKKQTIKVPEVEPTEPDSIFYHNVNFNNFILKFLCNSFNFSYF